MPVQEMFWGDRVGTVKNPFGYRWSLATHTRDLTTEEIRKAAEEAFARMEQKQGGPNAKFILLYVPFAAMVQRFPPARRRFRRRVIDPQVIGRSILSYS
jgi:hypothetical protein